MAVTDEIEALASKAEQDLEDLHLFKDHVQLMFRQFRDWVQQGNKLRKKNLATGQVLTEKDLIKLYRRYRTEYLLGLSFQHLVALFEVFLFDFMRLLLTSDPRRLGQKKQIDVETALTATDRPSLIQIIAEREIHSITHEKPSKWFEYLEKMIKLNCPTQDEIERLAEMKASRDLLVHNRGVVNAIYLNKAGGKARYVLGQQVVIDRLYFENGWALLKKMIRDIADAAKNKLGKPSGP